MEPSTLVGTAGVSLLLLAFFLNLFGFVSQKSSAYILLNIIGAGLAGCASWMIGFIPFVVLEATWMLVSVVGLVRKAAA
jgi:hypothetical protein